MHPHVADYLALGCSPGGTRRNIASAGLRLGASTEFQHNAMCDPQTSGGLLVIVDEKAENEFLATTTAADLSLQSIGRIVESGSAPLVEID
ncbi:MAG: hypothetical protein AB8G18_13365 [Gammaproteobacteria bacterium]